MILSTYYAYFFIWRSRRVEDGIEVIAADGDPVLSKLMFKEAVLSMTQNKLIPSR